MRVSALLETTMTSVERVTEYGKLKPEAALAMEQDESGGEPSGESGVVLEFKDVSMKYAEEERMVLKGLTFKIKEKEKVVKTVRVVWNQ